MVVDVIKYEANVTLQSMPGLLVVLEGSVLRRRDDKRAEELGPGQIFGDEDFFESEKENISEGVVVRAGPHGCQLAEVSKDILARALRYCGMPGELRDAMEQNSRVAAARKIYIFRHLSKQQT